MKKIVIDGIIFALQKTGGISKLWSDLLLALDQDFAKKNSVILLVPTNSNLEWQELKGKLKHIKSVKRRRFRWGLKNYFNTFYLTYLALKLRPALWHQTYYVGFPWFVRKRFTTFHDLIPERMGSAIPYDTEQKYRSLKRASKIVSISKHSQEDLEKYWPEFQGKSVVVRNGCASLSLKEGREKTILFVGRRRGYKNFLMGAKALLNDPRFDDYKIVAIGGESPLNEDEKAMGSRVEFVKPMPPQAVWEAYSKAALLLFPSLYEGFGLPVIEAFTAGCPVVAVNSSSIPEIVGDEYPLAKNDPQSIASTAFQILCEREKWVEYGKKRRELFSLEKMVHEMIDLYQGLS